MKAIYLNLDPYLQAFAAWVAAGKPGDAPAFAPLPVSVTLHPGERAAVYLQHAWDVDDNDFAPDYVTIGGTTIGVSAYTTPDTEHIARDIHPGLSALVPGGYYSVNPVSGSFSAIVGITDSNGSDIGSVTIPVVVNRVPATGPVELVDFAVPDSMSGVCLDGAWFRDQALRILKGGETVTSPVLVTPFGDASGTDVLTAASPGS